MSGGTTTFSFRNATVMKASMFGQKHCSLSDDPEIGKPPQQQAFHASDFSPRSNPQTVQAIAPGLASSNWIIKQVLQRCPAPF